MAELRKNGYSTNAIAKELGISGTMRNILKRKKTWGCSFVILIVLAGCEDVSSNVSESINSGTHKGYEACLKNNQSDSLGIDVVKQLCKKKHEKPISEYIAGTGNYYCYEDTCAQYVANVKNDTERYIITSFTISIENTALKTNENIDVSVWILPNQVEQVIANLNKKISSNNNKSYSWNITFPKGIEIKF